MTVKQFKKLRNYWSLQYKKEILIVWYSCYLSFCSCSAPNIFCFGVNLRTKTKFLLLFAFVNSLYASIFRVCYLHAFFINNTFISNTRLKLAKKQMLSNTLRLNFWHFLIIRILDPRYQPRIIGRIVIVIFQFRKKSSQLQSINIRV